MMNKQKSGACLVVANRKRLLSDLRRRLVVLCRVVPLFLMSSLSLHAETFSQTLSLKAKSIKLENVFKLIEEKTNYVVLYNYNELKAIEPIHVNVQHAQLNRFLDVVLKDLPLNYTIDDKTILISNKKKGKSLTTARQSTGSTMTESEQRVITGTVVNEEGVPLSGVTVAEKGTSNATSTSGEGEFELRTSAAQVTLHFSLVGYEPHDEIVGSRGGVRITLKAAVSDLDEVVVVGFGTQRKENLTGSVASVNMSDVVDSRPITSLSAGLAGQAPGLYVNQGSGRPGNDGGTLRVRGQGTLNNANPLVVIDGVVGDMNLINPQDVESISVLKDAASASIYGSRAANGVILITTKRGKTDQFRVVYNNYFSTQQPSNTINTVSNYANYMELINEGYKNGDPNANPIFSQGMIDLWRANEGQDPLKYPNTDWVDEVFQRKLSQNHNLAFSGGSEKIKFFGSYGLLDNPGVIEQATYKRHSGRINLEADVKPWLTLGANVNGVVSKTDIGTDVIGDVFTYAGASTPGMVLRAPDGRFGSVNNPEDDPQANNVLHRLYGRKGDINKNRLVSRFFAKLKPIAGLSIEGSYTYTYDDDFIYFQPMFNDRWNFLSNAVASAGTGRTSVTNESVKTYRYYMDGIARYENKTANDRLGYEIMVGASQEYYKDGWFRASKLDLIDPSLSVLNAATMDAAAAGNLTDWAMRSFFGRINLAWDDKYLLEANLRTDGSSRFMTGKSRWGTFPSVSAGWKVSSEDFYNVSWMPSFKVRASYGALGNNGTIDTRFRYDANINNYEYLTLYNAANYVLNNQLFVGFAQTGLSNALLTWENTYILNGGVDFDLFDYKLSGSVDVFNKTTNNILIDLPAPLVVGDASIPRTNAAKVRNVGVELTMNYKGTIRDDFRYNIGGNFTFIDNKVVKFKGEDRSISGANLIQEGYPINTQYILLADRILQTDADMQLVQQMIDNAPINPDTGNPVNPFAAYGTPQKGDLLYRDSNGDGVINDEDRVAVGNGTAPRITYGINMGFDYKGFDFAMLLQGNAGNKVIWTDNYFTPNVRWGYQINQDIADGRWIEGKTDAQYPRLLPYTDTRNSRNSDFWLQNKSFMRVKNIQLGYTLPNNISERFAVQNVRIFGSLENFWTFTDYMGFDPEVDGTQYPTMKQAVFGLSLTF
ncbi:SusC/RagA family TonB-linked outer membrane protein [Sphingobacterium haloxyli]|uniref:SusC/RagA family TonB-linked outer membrane protein n=1 Tax=Sphingobacterium haloxyli TaxID=2100533 RepID=A0A2S9J3A1_9SPHI|nr:TonB-dependent receptor [Sphingobacterium haloxyli]PRD47257.1 SusC/RagA family TonB-linked outer membrane protein [Sphingobacterium haloxyli]